MNIDGMNPYLKENNIDEYYCTEILLKALKNYLELYRPEHQQIQVSILKLLRASKTEVSVCPFEFYICDLECRVSKLDKIFETVRMKDPNSIALKQYIAFKKYPEDLQKRVIATLLAHNDSYNSQKVEAPKSDVSEEYDKIRAARFAKFAAQKSENVQPVSIETFINSLNIHSTKEVAARKSKNQK